MRLTRLIFTGMVAMTTADLSNAVATSDPAPVLEEIVVVAQKREQSLQDVPISMAVLDEEALKLRGFNNINDISFVVPNLAITSPVDSRTAQFTIRGITGQTFFPAAESAVGLFLDDVYLNNPRGQAFDLVDVERIEVLRGPQGTLYGKNATAGIIHMISKKPDSERRGDLLAEYGDYDNVRLRGRASGPIGGDFFGSVAAGMHKRDGFQKNDLLGTDLDDADAWNLRGVLRYAPDGPLEVNLSGDFMREDRHPQAASTSPEDREIALDHVGFDRRDSYGAALTVDFDIGRAARLTSLTAWREYDADLSNDSDGTALTAFNDFNQEDMREFSQELRLTSTDGGALDWLLGVYYLDTRLESANQPWIDPDPIFELSTGLPCSTLFAFQFMLQGLDPATAAVLASNICVPGQGDIESTVGGETWAGFGQATFAFNDQWSLTGGLRVSNEKKDFRLLQRSPETPIFLAYPVDEQLDRSDTNVDPMIALNWQPTDALSFYATVAKGSKSGGFNTGAVASPTQLADTQYDEEKLINYEVGLKAVVLGGRLRSNLAVFNIQYDDLQVFRTEELAPGVFSNRITNAANASVTGFEADLSLTTDFGLTLSGGVGYIDGKYDDYTNCGLNTAVPPQPIDCTSHKLTNAPDWTANLNGIYQRPIAPGIDFLVNLEWSYRGDVYYDVFNNDDAFQKGFSIFNGNIGLVHPDGRWSVLLWGTNLSDEDYLVMAIPGFRNTRLQAVGPPRMWGLRVTGAL